MKRSAPLADDWLFWDPEAVCAYPHSGDLGAQRPGFDGREPEQLELFEPTHVELRCARRDCVGRRGAIFR